MKCEACQHENIEGARFCAKCGAILASHEEGPDPLVGQVIGGRFRVTGVLGEGGMGKVYVGEQQMGTTVRKIAIKTLHAHLSKDPSVLARFHRECGTVAQLEHPNTIKFFDFGATNDGTLYIAMEFVAGKPLSDIIAKEGALAPERVVKIMRQVCGALDEAHMQGIIHRDLKPENLILTARAGETDFVKVLDFGIAARSESADAQREQKLTQQGMVLGTPPYMSPEQFTGKALDVRSDIYSLGVMSYEMLTGKLPFEADTPWQWATQHMTAQPTPFEVAAPAQNIPHGMRDAILKSLQKDREKRQASARDFFAELSGGGRMTVTGEAGAKAGGSSSTAAMEAAPDFGGGSPPVPVYAPAPAAHGAHGGHGVPPTAPGVVAAVPPPPVHARGGQGGGKGLIIGLGVVGVGLLAAMAVIAAKSMKSGDDDQPLANPFTEDAGTGAATIAPLVDAGDTPPLPTETSATPDATDAATPATTRTTPTSRPTSTSTKPATSATGTSTPTGGGAACDACIAAASAGNAVGAKTNFDKCTDEAKKRECATAVNRGAATAAVLAARNGQCAQAKAIIVAAKQMGATSKKLDVALNDTSCK
ncbi:MAG TPA: serine/threonine-protein kinase [Polyangiaceae bacterium]